MSLHRSRQNEYQMASQLNEDDWQNFDPKFGDFDKLKGMTKLCKSLEHFAVMVQGKRCGIPDLRRALDEIRNVKPKSVSSLVDLTKTDQVLADELLLKDTHRNTILKDILANRKKISEEIVSEGGKCSLVTDYAQIVNLFRAWSDIKAAKLVKNDANDKIDEAFDEAKALCGRTKALMILYTESNDPQVKENILEHLKVKTKEIHDVQENCFEMIQNIELQIGVNTIKLQFLYFEQKEASELNTKIALDKIGLGSIFNPLQLLVPLSYGILAGINYVESKVIEKTKLKLIEINQKLHELKQLAVEIKKIVEEAQTFIDSISNQ